MLYCFLNGLAIAFEGITSEREGIPMKYPDPEEFREFFRRLPRWVIPLIIVMLSIRFVLTLLFHILSK